MGIKKPSSGTISQLHRKAGASKHDRAFSPPSTDSIPLPLLAQSKATSKYYSKEELVFAGDRNILDKSIGASLKDIKISF